MNTINQTRFFADWLTGLRDQIAQKRTVARIRMAETGNLGDHHFIADGVWEMRIHHGPGYRLYYAQEGSEIYLLLAGGGKQTQGRDIEKATALWSEVKKKESDNVE
jgi:putative addiction module killer protein